MNFAITITILVGFAYFVDKLYGKINIDKYSPIWEYFLKAFLYGLILIFTLMYGKESIMEVNPLEWAIIAVSGIEGASNYISYVKEAKKEKRKNQSQNKQLVFYVV